MYRLHVHISVPDIDEAIGFYSALFAASPDKIKDGYARWMLDDPRVNFAVSVSSSDARTGLDHFGVQAETDEEFQTLIQRLRETRRTTADESNVHCCYSISDKSTVMDPAGLAWETFLTHGESEHWGTRPVEESEGEYAQI
jgi:catechol 2,3-dioxygenase-like lactoylglutathione lyase family enzyme